MLAVLRAIGSCELVVQVHRNWVMLSTAHGKMFRSEVARVPECFRAAGRQVNFLGNSKSWTRLLGQAMHVRDMRVPKIMEVEP